MRTLSLTLAAIAAAASLALTATPAAAATANLVSCTSGTSVTGRYMFTGIYQYGGQQFERSFVGVSYCPYTVEVY